jgi:hypothetical protein
MLNYCSLGARGMRGGRLRGSLLLFEYSKYCIYQLFSVNKLSYFDNSMHDF